MRGDVPEFETLRVENHGPVARLVLNRPEKLNAFTVAMWREMRELGARLLDDPGELRALVVTGEGRAFSSGIDTSVFTDGSFSETFSSDRADAAPDPLVETVLGFQESYTWLEEAPFVTIAAMRGYALGAGLQLALACDIRIAARGTEVGLLELEYGILPDLGGTQRLTRLVGPGRAKELIFTAARIDADDAERLGFVERVVADEELDDDALELAEAIAARPPLAVRGAKRAVNAATTGTTVREGLLVEAEMQAVCLRSDDMKEALTAMVEARPPVYRDR
jgi:enoyl-CoA hydratase/carnithine racemase